MEQVSVMIKGEQCIDLPPGFRFHPTDEEIITHYLSAKVLNRSFSARAIGEVDLNMCEPWDLPRKAKMGEKEWYFFCQRDRKYPTGMRTNRATEAGYWKATGKDKEICKGRATLLGMKKTLVFYKGRAPKGEKSNWVMHEYRLEGKLSCYNLSKTVKDEWVVCRIFQKNTGIKRNPISGLLRINPLGDHEFGTSNFLPPLMDSPYLALDRAGSNFIEDGFNFKETAAMRASDGIYLPFSTDMEEPENKKQIGASNQGYNDVLPFENSNFYSQIPHPNQVFTMQASSNLGSLHQEGKNPGSFFSNSGFGYTCGSNLKRQRCKVEQCSDFSYLEQNRDFPLEEQPRYGMSNQQRSFISVSQETGLSTDINTEISSVISKHELISTFYEDPEDLSAAEPVDLDCLWNY